MKVLIEQWFISNKMQKLEEENLLLNTENENLKNKREAWQSPDLVARIVYKNKVLHEEKEKMHDTIKLLNEINEKLTEHNINLANENEKLKQKLRDLGKPILCQQWDELGDKIERLEADNKELKSENDSLKNANQRYMENNALYEENYNWQIKQNEKLNEENQEFKVHIKRMLGLKPNKCPQCNILGRVLYCSKCSATGIVWERK